MNWVFTGITGSALAAVAAGLAACVLLLYVLRVRRQRVEVPFSSLWKKILEERQATSLWEKFKRVVSLLLHLLILALLVLAIADPRRGGELEGERAVVLIVDTSASMSALDERGGRTRIERAIDEARLVLRALSPRDSVMLVAMDGQLQPLTPFTREHDVVETRIRELQATATAANPVEALRFALESLVGRPDGEIVLVSDGAFDSETLENAAIDIPDNVSVVHIPIGGESENVAITAFNVRRYPSNRTNYEIFVELRSYVDTALEVELTIYGDGDRVVDFQRIPLGPRAVEERVYSDLPAAGDHLRAELEIVAGDAVDSFAVDDVAYALMPRKRAVRVLLVTDGNLYLEGPFLLNESVETDVIASADYRFSPGSDPSANYDVTVFDGVTPAVAASGNYMYFAPSGDFSPWEIRSEYEDPIIDKIRSSHPLTRWIYGMRAVNISRASRFAMTSNDTAIASSVRGAPLIIARETDRTRQIGVAFSLAESDMPLRVLFPLFLLNAIDWFTRDDASLLESFRTGDTWFVPITDRGLDSVTVRAPDGSIFDAQADNGMAVFYGQQTGYYQIEAGEERFEVAGNLADSGESDVSAQDGLRIGDMTLQSRFDESGRVGRYDPWVWLLLAAIALLLFEWFTWNRRLTV